MGYDTKRFVNEIDDEFLCVICTMVLENPVQSPRCEHSFCEKCITDWVAISSTCPVDRLPMQVEDLKPAARPLRNLLAKLDIRCTFESSGCNSIIKLENLDHHTNLCEFNPNVKGTCNKGCGLPIDQHEKEAHDCIKHLSRLVIDQQRDIAKLNTEMSKVKCYLTKQLWQRRDGIAIKEDDILQYALTNDTNYHAIAQSRHYLTSKNSYFEIKVLELGRTKVITIGLTRENYPRNRHPGWDQGSIGYHGDDGHLFIENVRGQNFGPQWTKGDTIGCGIVFPRNYAIMRSSPVEVYFKRNNVCVGKKIMLVPNGGFFPTIGMRSVGARVAVNLFL